MAATLREQLQAKRFGLVLSAGFFGFYGHAGFVRGLERAGLSPAAYAGTSAGALVAAYAAAGMDAGALGEMVLSHPRAAFWDPDPLGALRDGLRHGFTGLLRGERLRELLASTLPVATFEACVKPLVVVAMALESGEGRAFTRGPLAPPVHASCAYPGLFRAARVEEHLYWDGGLVDKAPVRALALSDAGRDLDTFVVHYLPSRISPRVSGALAYVQGMTAALGGLRRAHFELQVEALRAAGKVVHVVTSALPSVSPRAMHLGRAAMDAGERSALAALESA